MGTWSGCCERTVWLAPGGLLPSALELHLHFSPWPRPFLEPHCSCDPADPDALCWLHPRPALSPWICLPAIDLVAEPGFCHQTSFCYSGTALFIHRQCPCQPRHQPRLPACLPSQSTAFFLLPSYSCMNIQPKRHIPWYAKFSSPN